MAVDEVSDRACKRQKANLSAGTTTQQISVSSEHLGMTQIKLVVKMGLPGQLGEVFVDAAHSTAWHLVIPMHSSLPLRSGVWEVGAGES